MTWGGDTCFAIPDATGIADICIACLRQMDTSMRVPPNVIAEYGLQPIDPLRLRGFDIAEEERGN